MIITRRIEIYVDEPDPDLKKEHYNTLHNWRFTCLKAANILASHYFTLDNIKNMVYLDDEIKLKLADKNKDPEGILNTSYQNSGYRLLSGLFKGTIPTDILTNLNSNIQKTYKEEKNEYYKGDRSLRSYRNNIPVPFSARNVIFEKQENSKNYIFTIYRIPFATRLGADKSGNEIIIDRIQAGEYKFCNSSLYWHKKKNKWILLLCVDIPNTRLKAKKGVKVEADLNLLVPIIATCGKEIYEIGTKEEFLHQRQQIQNKLHNLQKSLRWATGGSGRKGKLDAIERFNKKEINYVTTKLHTYSRALVNFAIKKRAEKIELVNQELKEEIAKENELLLRNWSYYGLKQMIEYKAKQVGIEVSVTGINIE
jgi:IS605 OrfB family transposase